MKSDASGRFGGAHSTEAAGQLEAAGQELEQTISTLVDLGDPVEAQRFALELARMRGDLESARVCSEVFEAAGYHGYAHLARHYFPQLEATPHPREEPLPAQARLYVLGPVQLERQGQTLAYVGNKRSGLLAYLLERRIAGKTTQAQPQGVSTLELLDAFYPGVNESEARRTLKQQIYLIRRDLGRSSVLSTPSGYALGAVSSDAEDFLAHPDPALWRGSYLETLGEGWVSGVREALWLALRGTVECMSHADPAQALPLARTLCQMEPYDLEALHLTLGIALEAGGKNMAQGLYLERRKALLEVGETLPDTLSAFLESQKNLTPPS